MNTSTLVQLKHSQKTYSTQLVIENDPEYSNFSTKVVATDKGIDHRVIAAGPADVNGQLASLRVGDTISVEGYLSELDPYQQYRSHEHIVGIFHIQTLTDLHRSHSLLDRATYEMRNVIEKGCARLSANERGVCEGLLIGERTHIDKNLYNTYKTAQLTHLLVASGANIAFLVAFVQPFLKRLRIRTRSSLLMAIALFYCVATRCEPSIVRACVMVIIPSLASIRGFAISKANIFISTLVICILIDPFLIYHVGFWLSLSATAGLHFAAPAITRYVRSSLVANTLGATLCVQPVLWMTFGYHAPVRWPFSVIAIALAEPLSTIGMVGVAVISFLNPHAVIAELVTFLMHLGCSALNITAHIGASSQGYWAGWAFSILGIFAYTYRYRAINNRRDRNDDREETSGRDRQNRVVHYR